MTAQRCRLEQGENLCDCAACRAELAHEAALERAYERQSPRELWREQCRRFSDQALANQRAYGAPGGWSRAEILAEIERRGGIAARPDPAAARHTHPGRRGF